MIAFLCGQNFLWILPKLWELVFNEEASWLKLSSSCQRMWGVFQNNVRTVVLTCVYTSEFGEVLLIHVCICWEFYKPLSRPIFYVRFCSDKGKKMLPGPVAGTFFFSCIAFILDLGLLLRSSFYFQLNFFEKIENKHPVS